MELLTKLLLNKYKNQGGGGPTPTGTIDITQNGTYNVSSYASADVDVPQPSGSISITTNGEVDVTNYETANVNVQAPSEYNGKFATQLPLGSPYNSIIRYVKETPEFNLGSFTTCSSFFSNCDSLEKVALFNTAKVTTTKYMFQNCPKITEIPQFNTIKVTDMGYMFGACESLVTVPILDTHLVSPYNMGNMFQLCASLSDESLNNILYMCANCKNDGTNYKTLQWIGLSSTQATKCTTLSNWSACTAKGWTTGY